MGLGLGSGLGSGLGQVGGEELGEVRRGAGVPVVEEARVELEQEGRSVEEG